MDMQIYEVPNFLDRRVLSPKERLGLVKIIGALCHMLTQKRISCCSLDILFHINSFSLCFVFYQGYLQYILKLFENNKTNLTMKCRLSKRRSVLQCFRNFIQNNNQLFLKRFEKVIHLEQLEVITQRQQIKMSEFGNKREALNYWWGMWLESDLFAGLCRIQYCWEIFIC